MGEQFLPSQTCHSYQAASRAIFCLPGLPSQELGLIFWAATGAVLLIYLGARRVARFLGDSGTKVLPRLMGMITMAIAAEFFFSGLTPLPQKMMQPECSLGFSQREHRHFGPYAEAESQSISNALVDIHGLIFVPTHPRGQATCILADKKPPQTGPVHLATVGVAAQHQVAAFLTKLLDCQRIVCQNQPRGIRAQSSQGGHRIALTRPKVINSCNLKRNALMIENRRSVAKNSNATRLKRIGHGQVQAAMASPAQRVSHGKIVIAKHRECAERCFQGSQRLGHVRHMPVALVNKIPRQSNEVRFQAQCPFDHFRKIVLGKMFATMKIRQMRNSQSLECRVQIRYWQRNLIRFQPCRLDLAAITYSGPRTTNPACRPVP